MSAGQTEVRIRTVCGHASLRPTRGARAADAEPALASFDEHFDKRKVELGSCARPYGTLCQHEHACIRCPMLDINPAMLPRLAELETDLQARRARASAEGWLGEIEGIDLTLRLRREKQARTSKLAETAGRVALGMPRRRPDHASGRGSTRAAVAGRESTARG